MNYGHFAGRLGRNADLRQTPDGKPVCNFVLAVDTGYGDRNETLWIDCTLWGERGEKLAPYLEKGKAVTVSGDVGLRTFQKRDGSTGASLTCNVQRVTLQGGGNGGSQTQASSGDASQSAQSAITRSEASVPAREQRAPAEAGGFDDDIPFLPCEYRSIA